MNNITTICNFLNIDYKDVESLDIVEQNNQQIICLTLSSKESFCRYCNDSHIELKEYKTRTIKHSLFIGKETIFKIKIRRYRCLRCGKTFTLSNKFTPSKSKVSFETINLVLKLAKDLNLTWKSISEICHVSNTTCVNIFDKYIGFNRETLPTIICFDECYNKNQFSKPYSFIILNFNSKKIIDIIEGRKKTDLAKYFSKIKPVERENVKFIIIDMWDPYLDIANIYFPRAIVAIDSFHVIKNISDALDNVRKRFMKKFDTNSNEYYLLKKFKYLLFNQYSPADEKRKNKKFYGRYYNYFDLQQMVLNIHPDLKLAHEFYINYRNINKYCTFENAGYEIEKLINNNPIINVEEFISILSMIQKWKPWIVNSFIKVNARRLSNGPIEGFNSMYKKMMRIANGVTNFERFKNRLIYIYNKNPIMLSTKHKSVKKIGKKRGLYKKSTR